jgi:hypothetical protein
LGAVAALGLAGVAVAVAVHRVKRKFLEDEGEDRGEEENGAPPTA